MNFLYAIFPIAVALNLFSGIASSGQVNFQKSFGGSGDDDVRNIKLASDGNFLVAGSTLSYGSGSTDAYLFKTDENGRVLWSKAYGGTSDDYFEWVEPTHDNGIILCGYKFSVVKQSFEIIVIKTDSAGNVQWQSQIPLTAVARAYCIRQTFDKGYILCGEEDSSGIDGNILLVKMDSLGNLQWNKSYGIPLNLDAGNCVIQTKDSGFALCGQSRYGFNSSYAVILKTDNVGNLEWSKNYFNSNPAYNKSYPDRIIEIENAQLIVSGSSYLVGQPLSNVFLCSIDSLGSVLWSNLYSTGTSDAAHDLIELPEGKGFLLCGHTSSPNTGITNAMLLKVDRNGNLLWNENYGNDTLDGNFYAMAFKSWNRIFLGGNSYSFGAGGQDIILAGRDSAELSSDCYTHSVLFTTIPFPLMDQGPVTTYPLSLALTTLNFSTSTGIQSAPVCLNSGINELESEDLFFIYPNPGGQARILENYSEEIIYGLKLIDISGKIVWTQILNSKEEKINVELPEIAPGYYWFEISTEKRRLIRMLVQD